MKTRTILVALLAVTAVWATPSTTEANTILLNDTTALLTIDFSFNASGGNYELPVVASSTVGYFDRADVLGYALTGADVLSSSALVLSRNPLTGVRYSIDEDETANFTLFIIATLSAPLANELSATITKIPYWVGDRRTTVHQNQLDELATAILAAK